MTLSTNPPTRLVRRIAALAISALLVTGALAACAPADASRSGSGSESASGSWTFTDDTGKKVTLDHRPERVASYADYALGLLSYDISPVALFGRVDVKTDPRFDGYDISKSAIVGNSYGEIDLEKLAEAQPDLIVTGIYPKDRKGTLDRKGALYAFADVEQQKQIEKIAPVVAIEVGGTGMDVIASMNRLARALGASADTIDRAKTEFDAAAADLTAAAKESGLEVTQMYADADGLYVVKPADEPETQLYRSLGVTYTDLHPGGAYYWDKYSWENASTMMTGDIVLANVEGFQVAQLKEQATFASSPALRAGQVYSWQGAALDYASQAAHMTELAKLLRSAKKV